MSIEMRLHKYNLESQIEKMRLLKARLNWI